MRFTENLKGIYQYGRARLPEISASLMHNYRYEEAIQRARRKLVTRFSDFDTKNYNFIMAVPVTNWETVLIETSNKFGDCHHINFESRSFFDSKQSWNSFKENNKKKLIDGINQAYDENTINIVFLYLSEFHIDPDCIDDIQRKNTVIILFNWDDRLYYRNKFQKQSVGVSRLVNKVDICLTLAVTSLNRYVADKGSAFYWDGIELSQDEEVSPLPEVEYNRVLFFGTKYGYRETLINHLVRSGVDIDVYGKGWGTKFISYNDLTYKIPRYTLNLGISTIGYTRNLFCLKGRDFEVPSLGGLYATNLSKEALHAYSKDEIILYKDKDDCLKIVNQVLNDPDRFAEVRRKGFKKSLRYSWPNRFKFLLSLVESILVE